MGSRTRFGGQNEPIRARFRPTAPKRAFWGRFQVHNRGAWLSMGRRQIELRGPQLKEELQIVRTAVCLLESADPARQTARLESTRPEKRLSELEKSLSGKCPDLAAGPRSGPSVTGWPEVEKVKSSNLAPIRLKRHIWVILRFRLFRPRIVTRCPRKRPRLARPMKF